MHGIRLSASMWAPHAARLIPRFRITACDLPGHGALRGRPFTLDGAIAQVDAAVAAAHTACGRPPWIAGSSLGGYTTLAYCAAHPGRVAGALVNGATADTRARVARLFRTAAHVVELLGEERAERLNNRVFRRLLPPESHAAVMRGGLSMPAFGDCVADLTRRDLLATARRCTTATVFVNGRRDRLFRAEEKAFVRAVRDAGAPARLALVPGGHLLCLTDPDAFSRVLARGHQELVRLTSPPADPLRESP
ncbi:alpha/beta fold hydrolase [Kitasatospora sp. NPDC048296]|uniref:alpha/beta fold hydrolase n=1 Tax=Kitasatospora sp. NPDC048296 TaxID=3364048 RepID=UPI00370FC0C6